MKKARVKIDFSQAAGSLKKILALVKDQRRVFFILAFLILIIELLNLAGQYVFKEIIDALTILTGAELIERVIYWLAILTVIYLVNAILNYFNNFMTVKTEVMVAHGLSLTVFSKLLKLSLGFHETENTGAKLEKINNGIDSVRRLYVNVFWDVLPLVFRIVGSIGLLLLVDYRIAISFAGIVPFYIWSTISLNRKVYPINKNIRRAYERVYGGFGQAIYSIKTVQAYVKENYELKRAKIGIAGIIRNQLLFFKSLFGYNFLREFLVSAGIISVVGFGTYLAVNQRITVGELVLSLTVSISSYYYLYGLTRVFDSMLEAQVGVGRLMKILDSQAEIVQKTNAVRVKIRGQIEFDRVSFAYSKTPVLKNISLKIHAGETVALVGPSGGGKTTLAKLIYRYFDVSHGGILVDGYDIRDLDLANYREQLSIVDQDIDIFNDTIKNNIAYGDQRASLEKIKAAARIANAHEFIDKLDKKYNTMVGERGIKLSGGQKQRLGIARAILVDPKILIMDEATSSLDAGSERMIQSAINQVIKNRTTIIIAHRLSTIKNVDRILVVEKGRIVEQGTHRELMAKQAVYAGLVKLQIDGYLL